MTIEKLWLVEVFSASWIPAGIYSTELRAKARVKALIKADVAAVADAEITVLTIDEDRDF